MGEVSDYYATLPPDVGELFEGMRRRALKLVPDVVEGRSYGMPALLYQGKGLMATMQTAKHLALYPFSGKVVAQVAERLPGFSLSSGTIRFSVGQPVPDDVLDDIVRLRAAEIDAAQ
ncbi:iron chaperone [Catenulispora sp. GP43]|uniref:iron chaperone n=1 Tax=Catenulispora sp. GP43 TaxID=3156263 RepID=UPI0035140BC0